MIVGTPGNDVPGAFELKLGFAHDPESESPGNRPACARRARAAAASARKPAIETDGGTAGEPPVAWRTASAKERRRGAGDCATSESAQISARRRDRKRVGEGKSVDLGGRRIIKKK